MSHLTVVFLICADGILFIASSDYTKEKKQFWQFFYSLAAGTILRAGESRYTKLNSSPDRPPRIP